MMVSAGLRHSLLTARNSFDANWRRHIAVNPVKLELAARIKLRLAEWRPDQTSQE